jgi:hypothetical protein
VVASDQMDQLAPFRNKPPTVESQSEAGLAVARRSAVPWVCALIVALLIEIAWIVLLLFFVRVVIF